MAILNTHARINKFIEHGFTKEQAEAILCCFNRPLNTLTFYKKLIEAGFTEQQAETIVDFSWEVTTNNE